MKNNKFIEYPYMFVKGLGALFMIAYTIIAIAITGPIIKRNKKRLFIRE